MADTPFHFFKVILPSALQDKKLGIPKKFAEKFEKELSNIVTLMIPNGRIWHVGLRKDEGKLWFYDGWHDFVEYHSISAGYFLVFKYEKHPNFRVLIFDITCCEIQYPYFCLSPKIDESAHHNEMENEDSTTPHSAPNPNPPEFSSFENNSFEKCSKSSGKNYTPTPLQQIQAIDIPESSSRPCSGSIPEIKHGYETPSKRLKVEEPVEINKLDTTGDESELKNAAYKVEAHSSDDEAKTTKIDKLELLTLFEDMKISICRNVEYLTAKQRERAVDVARLCNPKNPAFMVILQSRNITKSFLYVPSNFAGKYLSRNAKSIRLQVSDGREWRVHIVRRQSAADFTKGVAKFFRENRLKDGDICVFEVITKDILLKVSVFHSN
ncbi:hypothetical protein Dsin_026963 [Dipteronia sinensis]|uniref:TF-B3 domain-containing protein n=1 Tax=Dipteronia sinensis TaxID=43782 RepID=A0AAE0A007_9ROSI|nr:hypothetical protein Dsin_026963 [Dipteronia sinensis]